MVRLFYQMCIMVTLITVCCYYTLLYAHNNGFSQMRLNFSMENSINTSPG